uniref:Tetratricopeptide repeat domain 12 n=1 Tax=Poecilia latipinna TaxID=48699 RepID=A0A3B3VJR2_9TELE
HFMKVMSRDAEERGRKRMVKLKEATLKDKGNEAYAQEDYETAVKCYSDGLAVLRDMQPLYTNRAQAYIKLERYEEAIMDCEWALKQCNERCIKAYVHMGKAYLGLKNYNEARSCFEKILEIESGKESMVKEYLDLVDLEEEKNSQETDAKEKLDKGERKATAVPQLLEKLSRPGQMPLYYCGGLESLSQAVTDAGKTLFRLNNGFSIIGSNDVLKNQKILMKCPLGRQSVVQLLTSDHGEVVKECLELLSLYSNTLYGRRLAIDNLDLHKQCGSSEYNDVIHLMLGLIISLSTVTSLTIQRAMGVLSTVLPQSSEAVQHAVRRKVIHTICWLLKRKGQTATKFAVKTLTVCTAVGDTAREELVKTDKLSILRRLLRSNSDEVISGNAALCLSHCFELEGVATHLLGTDIVLLLLRLAAGEPKKTAVQQNAAIALSKLCRSEPHVHKLRELHGLEILHSCV